METTGILNIERPAELLHYLREHGHIRRDEAPVFTPLPGGVSNRTVRVDRVEGDSFVLKQALARLRVETEWYSDPRRIGQEALGLEWLERLAPAGTITPLRFRDANQHLLAMQAVPLPHENWKTRLLAGGLQRQHVGQFGGLLGTIHRRSWEQPAELSARFDNRTFFESLRLEPYYRFTASRHAAATKFFGDLIAETLATRIALTHGDYSPKNVLVYQDRLVLLDHEVIHFGDPAFDLGFSLTHFLSKANHLPAQRKEFLDATRFCWQTYQQTAAELAKTDGFEARAVRHTLGCLLARVDGRSPLEYLSAAERDRQRTVVLTLIRKPPERIPELVETLDNELQQTDKHALPNAAC